ncbi:DUF2238 domain-containing protein [Parerythrobacter aestuarii]|uniref:DUF2238 domain-containing protein n=1 Tax=Parerythrobacter aestuarii TaxID=3020909 RepID=UPI0024DEA860|nr:DUF2238 domain-containing protein [Parerythrobacter aestuarii]
MEAWRALPAPQRWMIGFGLIGLALMQIGQPYPEVAVLHHTPTLIALISAPFLLRRFPLSNAAFGCLMLFLVLHTVGGRYTYTNMPYDAWFEALTGTGFNELMGWQRNNYDRLVHFSFGLLFVLPLVEFLRDHAGVARKLALYFAVEFVVAISGIYEIVEWTLSILLAPDNVEAYNGQQGDYWDAQKDMALAFLGSLVAAAVIALRRSLGRPNAV